MRKRYPLNVVGDFFVEDGCCISCGLAHAEAPGFLAEFEETIDGHCYVKRQPQTPQEIDEAIDAIMISEVKCIHYEGNSIEILEKIIQRLKNWDVPYLVKEYEDILEGKKKDEFKTNR
jgi:hypothetical protein